MTKVVPLGSLSERDEAEVRSWFKGIGPTLPEVCAFIGILITLGCQVAMLTR